MEKEKEIELERNLNKYGYNIEKYRKLNRKDKKTICERWLDTYKITMPSRRQNESVYIVIQNDKRKSFFSWLKSDKLGEKIRGA